VRIKTDENIARRAVELLRNAGHDVATVREQGLEGATDHRVFDACVAERRTLLTLDRGFGELLRFPPERGAGVVILELGGPASMQLLIDRVCEFIALATTRPINRELWIIEPGRVRIRRQEQEQP